MAVAILAQGYNFEQNPKHTQDIPLVHGSGARLIELDFCQDPTDTDERGPLRSNSRSSLSSRPLSTPVNNGVPGISPSERLRQSAIGRHTSQRAADPGDLAFTRSSRFAVSGR